MTLVGTGLDANGWSTFTPSADTRIIYVSSSTGNDSNNGLSPTTAVATIAQGLSLIRDGSADWLLLRAGDVWVDQSFSWLHFSGRSGTEPILISSYGDGARPLILTPSNSDLAIGSLNHGTTGSNLAIVGLEFYDYTRDPSNQAYVGTGTGQHTGMFFLGPLDNLLIEDCKFSFYTVNAIQGSVDDAILRRNIIENNYSTNSHSQGLYADDVENLVLEQNLFNHNGWNESVVGAEATIFNHNVYIQDNCGLATVIGNIFANAASHGIQVRSGGTVSDNLFISNPISLQIGSIEPGKFASTATVSGNVILEGDDITGSLPRGFGIELYPDTGLVEVHNNIIAHDASAQPWGHGIYVYAGADNDLITNNIIYDWIGAGAIIDQGQGNTISPNAIDQTGYLDPNRSVETYMASIGGSSTFSAFLAAAENQSKSNWNPQYTAAEVNSYIAAGFATTSDAEFKGYDYLASYDDLIIAFGPNEMNAFGHYIHYGVFEGRQADAFDGYQYLATHDDLITAFGANEQAAAFHFVSYGFEEGRTRDGFDGNQYIASYGDLIEAFGANEQAGGQHFVSYGFAEGRARDEFDATQYLASLPDLQAAFGTDEAAATMHFITYGYFEGRTDMLIM